MVRRLVAILGLVFSAAGAAAEDDLAGFYQRYQASMQSEHPHEVHRVPRDGHMLHVREFAAARPQAEPPIMLMHGFPDSSHLYDRLAPLLATGHRVIAFDFLGWGNSDAPDGHVYDVASLQRDLNVVVDHFGLDDVILVVHDASGPPGIDWALDHQDRT